MIYALNVFNLTFTRELDHGLHLDPVRTLGPEQMGKLRLVN